MSEDKKITYTGFLPDPKIIAAYKKVSPQAFGRIITLAEGQAKHRQKLEKEIVESNIKNEKRGRDYAFVTTILLVLIGGWLILQGKDILGFTILVGLPLFNAYNFLRFRKISEQQKKMREKEILKEQKNNNFK